MQEQVQLDIPPRASVAPAARANGATTTLDGRRIARGGLGLLSVLVWDAACLLFVGLVALALRLPNLEVYTASLSEGIRLEQLRLMAAGYRNCEDIFCNQGPLALEVMYPTFALFGQTLAAARSSALIASLVGLAGAYWIARQLWGRSTAVLGGLLLAISAVYLKASRLAFPEIIALAPAVLAVGAALHYRRSGGRPALLAASVLFGLSLLIKPIAVSAIVPIGLLTAGRLGVRRRELLLAAGAGTAVVVLGLLVVGLPRIWEQAVFRWQSRLVEGRGMDWNWGLIVDELGNDQLGIFALSGAAVAGLVRTNRQGLAVLGGWCAANLALLLLHTPLHFKHIVILLPPIALLAGYALRTLLGWLTSLRSRPHLRLRPSWQALVAAAAAAIYLATLPGLITRDTALLSANELLEHDPAQYWYADATAAVASTTPPGSFVVTDFPYLAFAADRLVPPQLVEASLTRIRAGSLTDQVAIAESSRFEPQAILLWWDRLVRLSAFKRWMDQRYQVVRVYATDREAVTTLYLPLGTDVAATRAKLSGGASTASGARFGNGLLLSSWGLDSAEAAPGDSRSLTIVWQASERLGSNLAAVLSLRSPDRVVWSSQRLPLLGSGDGQRGWQPGRWVVWSGLVAIHPKLAPGSYVLSVRVAEGESGDFVPVQAADRPRLAADDPKGLELSAIEVTGPRGRKRPN